MSDEVLLRVCEPMFSTENFGAGPGVPIINNIVEGHGGGVDYESEVGNGFAVAMRLPIESKGRRELAFPPESQMSIRLATARCKGNF